jgi:glycerol-3-phosphate acyltransferase PlsY
MLLIQVVVLLVVSYFFGAIPSGLIIVKLMTGKDIRQVESGRTGGTNAARAAGFSAGALTGVFDFVKGAIPVWLAYAAGASDWLVVACPLIAILGHNYSIFLAERDENGKLHLKGGAGGATCMGGAFGLWPWSLLIIGPVSMAILFGLGYASVATMSMAFTAIIVFAVRAYLGYSPWIYVLYGVFSLLILMWSLRPNIKRLIQGNERLIGWRAKRQKAPPQQNHA